MSNHQKLKDRPSLYYRFLSILLISFILLSCNLPVREPISTQTLVDRIRIDGILNVFFNQEITIKSPGNGAKFEEGSSIILSASVKKDYSRGIVEWSSSIDGFLGNGKYLEVSELSTGVHRIESRVTDLTGNFQDSSYLKDSIQIEVYEKSEPLDIEACVIPPDGYDWSYEEKESQFGTGGNAKDMPSCSAKFVFKNNMNEDVHLIYYYVFDNDAMHSENWKGSAIEANGEWSDRVSHTEYVDGSVTYSEILKILLLRNDPDCTPFQDIMDDHNEILWERKATPIERLPCP